MPKISWVAWLLLVMVTVFGPASLLMPVGSTLWTQRLGISGSVHTGLQHIPATVDIDPDTLNRHS